MRIIVETIPHKFQRYETIGDWFFKEDDLMVKVSDLGNIYYEWFVAEHEINEALMCKKDGISEKQVSDYDKAFEQLRKEYPELIGEQEPGDMISAPYNSQHKRATQIESVSVSLHGENWDEYEKAVNNL